MWYVIQTISGTEHEVCLWINCNVDKKYYDRCFVPLFENVWKKDGIGHINIKRMFEGYLFIETDVPQFVNEELKKMPKFTNLLSSEDKDGRIFMALMQDEECFFNTVLSDGTMRVSYVQTNRCGKLDIVIGPLEEYRDNIIRVDYSHRYAIVSIPFLGGDKTIKMGLWLDNDPKRPWIEKEKQSNSKKAITTNEDYSKYEIGGYVINTVGLYGDTPLELYKIHPEKRSVTVIASLFGRNIKMEMKMDDVKVIR